VDQIAANIHVAREQFHLAWDNTIAPVARVPLGGVLEFDQLDAAGYSVRIGRVRMPR
jgi:hypothetical protein